MAHAFSSLDELGVGPGFRKIRKPLGVTAFGVNAVVYPPGFPGVHHYHDIQDELYFVHSGTARVEVEGEEKILGPGGLFHVESTTPRRIANVGEDELVLLVVGGKDGYVERDGHVMSDEDDLVLLVIGGKDGYVERDGHMVDEADVERRAAFGR